jgi:hypothetical protein
MDEHDRLVALVVASIRLLAALVDYLWGDLN